MIIGTAGHIDHGKTVLIKALTGVNTDRLAEEQKRGISIELGFAEFKLPSGRTAGVVDVPGHEAFIKNMLAGATGFDLVLLVVAADDGVMPQTTEHLSIIDMLGVKRGVVVITKSDLVDKDMIELVKDDIRETLKGTVLEDSPIIPVSAITGEGIEELLKMIDDVAKSVELRESAEAFRLPVDRVFTLKGVGTVVTGTLWSGEIHPDDSAVVLPGNKPTRIRSVQVHGATVKQATAGNRVAVNLHGIDRDDIHRGDVLAQPGLMKSTYMIDAEFRLLKDVKNPVKNWTRVRVHHGTAEVMARIVLLDRDVMQPGDIALVEVRLEKPIVVRAGDRFIIRSYSPMNTIGGGEVLESHPSRHRRFDDETMALLKALERHDHAQALELMMKKERCTMSLKELAERMELEPDEMDKVLAEVVKEGNIIELKSGKDTFYMSSHIYNQFQEKIMDMVNEHHAKYPLERGINKEVLKSSVLRSCPPKAAEAVFRTIEGKGRIKVEREVVMAPDKQPESGPMATLDGLVESGFLEGGFMPPAPKNFEQMLKLNNREVKTILAQLRDEKRIVEVTTGMYFHADMVVMAEEMIKDFLKQRGVITPGEFKDLVGTSRKFAIPLLEYFDRKGVTKREGDYRVLV
jgi:selenocysteine-specific elongation factor